MNAIQLDFRKHLSPSDRNFIIDCLAGSPAEADGLLRLLTDPNTVDDILDQPQLIETILNSIDNLRLSARLYFYLVTRHSLKRSGLDDPDLADYISGVLDEQLNRRNGAPGQQSVFYFVDWLNQLEQSPKEKHFNLYVMAGNYLLFLTGIFPQSIQERRRRRGAPGLDFYEDVGRYSFESAARHARGIDVSAESRLYARLADQFSDLRSALNDASDRLLHLDPAVPYDIEG